MGYTPPPPPLRHQIRRYIRTGERVRAHGTEKYFVGGVLCDYCCSTWNFILESCSICGARRELQSWMKPPEIVGTVIDNGAVDPPSWRVVALFVAAIVTLFLASISLARHIGPFLWDGALDSGTESTGPR